MSPSLSRRDAILSALAAAVAASGPALLVEAALAAEGVDLDAFVALSETLTGADASALDRDVAATLLGGLLATGHGEGLKRLVADPAAERALGDAIVAAWYTGLYDTGTGQAVATFNDALLWRAMSFTKPPGNCGGETGYWAGPPA